MRTRLRRPAIVAAFALLFLHGTETTYASETVGINLVLSLETTSYSEAAAEPRLLAPETVSLPALMAVVEAIDVARSARQRALENFSFAAVYNLVAAPAAMLGLVNPFVAALAMSGSSLVVTLNALRVRNRR